MRIRKFNESVVLYTEKEGRFNEASEYDDKYIKDIFEVEFENAEEFDVVDISLKWFDGLRNSIDDTKSYGLKYDIIKNIRAEVDMVVQFKSGSILDKLEKFWEYGERSEHEKYEYEVKWQCKILIDKTLAIMNKKYNGIEILIPVGAIYISDLDDTVRIHMKCKFTNE